MLAYRLLIILLSPLILAHLLWKSLRLGQSRFLYQRLGFGIGHIPENCLWFHCASVGEANTVLPLLKKLREKNPEQAILVTTNTITGAEIVDRQNLPWLFHAYLPMDWSSTVKRFVNKIQPAALYIMETELWPNLVDVFYRRGMPVSIINGRLSKKTTEANAWVRSVYRQTLSRVEHIYVRSEKDAALYRALGASDEQVSILGNLKFTPPASHSTPAQTATEREYIVVASTHNNEELRIAEIWKQLNRNELLVIAPRHPDRSEHIVKQLGTVYAQNDIAVRSRNDVIGLHTRLYLLDTVGELAGWFAAARLVVMAGSFIHRGGHNILEPAHLGKAIIFGPHMESFVDESELLLANSGAIQVGSFDELKQTLAQLLDDQAALAGLENNAAAAVAQFSNILDNYSKALAQ